MIAFFDGNTVWRRKFADALQRQLRDVAIVCPTTAHVAATVDPEAIHPFVPRGWASIFSAFTMPYLGRTVEKQASRRDRRLQAIFVTAPHYLRIARRAHSKIACYYYCSDDYLGYDGWPVEATKAREHELCSMATAAIFVSEGLRERAIASYGIARERTFVSPNATDARFGESAPSVPKQLALLPRPIFGVAGMLTKRIDFEFLLELADSTTGSLALVGPFDPGVDDERAVQRLRAHERVHCFGWQPHEALHAWVSGFDIAVIPYRDSEFNRLCSPMRLFDHMAIGHPILATSACDQLRHYREVTLAVPGQFSEAMQVVLDRCAKPRTRRIETWDDRVETLLNDPIGASLAPRHW